MMARFWCILLCAFISAIIAFLVVVQTGAKRTALAKSTLFVKLSQGHGSGVHIGNRYVITAEHVVGSESAVTLGDSAGNQYHADVLWKNRSLDVALLRAPAMAGVAASRLSCDDPPEVGQIIEAVGNPGSLEFVHSWGHVSGKVQTHWRWAVAFIADLGIALGSSGGPVFDHKGRVIGIVVGVSLASLDGMIMHPTNFSVIVPARGAICMLLSRNSE